MSILLSVNTNTALIKSQYWQKTRRVHLVPFTLLLVNKHVRGFCRLSLASVSNNFKILVNTHLCSAGQPWSGKVYFLWIHMVQSLQRLCLVHSTYCQDIWCVHPVSLVTGTLLHFGKTHFVAPNSITSVSCEYTLTLFHVSANLMKSTSCQ